MASIPEAAMASETAVRSLEDALRELHYQKKALDEHAIVAVADANQNIVDVNQKFCEISQFEADELIGGHIFIGLGDEHSEDFFYDMISTTRSGKIWHGLLCNRRKDESIYWTDTTIVPFCDESGTPYKYVVIRTDISQQKEIEAEIRAKKAEIEKAHHELAEAQADLLQAEKLASIGRLAAGIAHEINTPTQFIGDNTRFMKEAFEDLMQLIQAYRDVTEAAKGGAVSADLLEKVANVADEVDAEYLAEEIPSAIDQALEGVKRVSSIVLSMKEFSHPGSAAKSHIDINHALETTITVSKNEWKYCAELVTEFDPGLPQVPCLPGELNQAFLNMIVNAAHAIEAKQDGESRELGKITVATSHDDEYATIRISDTGTGIPEDVRSRVFDPFFTTKDVGKGTGQGLAVARSVVVDKHGGKLSVESTMGEGSTFTIRLPLTEPDHLDD